MNPSAEAADPLAEGAAGSEPEVSELKLALASAEQAAAAARDQQLRPLAHIVQFRQRFALERFAGELLGVRDSLELAAQSAAKAGAGDAAAGSSAAGVQATLQLLVKAFDKFSIVRIDPQGAAFDPAQHEAVLAQESASAPADSVLQVLQSGYQLNGRLLRPARVVVARAPQNGA